jgi:hypothetical protein
MMNRLIPTLTAGALVAAFATLPAAAQNLPAPGNVNPGSLYSGAEQTGATNQPRSPGAYAYGIGPGNRGVGADTGMTAGAAVAYAYSPSAAAIGYSRAAGDAYAYSPTGGVYVGTPIAGAYAYGPGYGPGFGVQVGPFAFAAGHGPYGYGTRGAGAIGAPRY